MIQRNRRESATACALVADDNDGIRRLVTHVVTRAGFTVLSASNGAAALHAAEAHGDPIVLVVTDIEMPILSGLDLAEAVAKHFPDVRVLLMSGRPLPEDAARRLARVRYVFLPKPFDLPSLYGALTRLTADSGEEL